MAFIPDEAIDRMTELSAGAWRLYCFLARCRNQKTGKCCPSAQTLARVMDMERRHIFRLKNELAEVGWAKFDGGDVTGLLGFSGDKNVTSAGDKNSSVEKVTSAKNVTAEGQKCHPKVSKMSLAYKEEPAKEPAKGTNVGAAAPDARTQHAAIQTCRQVAKSYPPKELWDKLIRVLGDTPNTTLLVECRAEWVERGYNKASWKWATEWYATGVPARTLGSPPKQSKAAYVGATKPTREKQVNAEDLAFMEAYIDGLIAANDFIHLADEYDRIVRDGGAKAEWEIRCVAYYELHKNEPATTEQVAELKGKITEIVPRSAR